MQMLTESTTGAVVERHFLHDGLPGILWSPAQRTEAGPIVLVAHGGGQSTASPGVDARARRFAAAGFATAAIDAPGHGARPQTAVDTTFRARLRELAASGEPLGPHVERYSATLAEQMVAEWQTVLDALDAAGESDPGGPVGVSGHSLGGVVGLYLAAQVSRVAAAALGLIGAPSLVEVARSVTIPVEFDLQWNDELVPRTDALALFDALASSEKTLHANPGRHTEVPRFEIDSAARFFARHLG